MNQATNTKQGKITGRIFGSNTPGKQSRFDDFEDIQSTFDAFREDNQNE